MRKIALVTVTFKDDFRLTLLQAMSIDRLVDLSTISRYILIVNCTDADFQAHHDWIVSSLEKAISTELLAKTQILKWTDFFPESLRIGFYDQQILKLSVAKFIYEPYYVLLDGKNHFVRIASSDSFFKDGKPIAQIVNTSKYWETNAQGSFRALQVDNPEKYWEKMIPSITPFVMNTKVVNQLLDYIHATYGQSLPEFFKGREGTATEFLLYYSFLCKVDKLADYYLTEHTQVHTLFVISPEDPKILDRMVREASNREVLMFGLHRKRIPNLSNVQRESILSMWKNSILYAWEDASWFMKLEEGL
ncbi:DUF6492 family protein [Corynebacterium glucuronolyticum]|uniref:Uncharacterized protein n=2 Tax=Corynebacterium glucuronolyticum TaxID=39791 RepID=A0A7T4JW16_9CORY|nr:DUF6492 family protein [Corynebacterium glucuronolyticum]EEI62310.1 hypothetical protein HMPREF0293_2205 [Corynebacterium glucuronolyticum ATCC 51866]QQB47417.1 hypothetical protein I6I10_05895 [Corynebacterium glucuronolyticum]QRP70038.1 hypothetical protein I6J21_09640 [Corynebacterium glucuronolyticum]WKD64247.1 hypothetical protein CGLUCO_10045 [Corynebacterium glucuronolyticum DSM 44120]SMB83432.1 hypothetical protein SAMN05660745_02656 [Corynebacterium glucuronolyticum]